ncbi:MAG: DegT/DnrJ/EryC1/StrS family aminotransferase [Candidatus Pacearchaeota archaeon]|nr:DegT/DnrJ/EryC1/StrS family aminotransferase [Candidatus Pacearchaeota archaeon]
MNNVTSWKRWERHGDLHLMNRVQWDREELEKMMIPFLQDWHGYGNAQQELEQKLSDFTGIKYFNLTSSGSTAIMTALKVLKEQGRLNPGDLVLHPITTFPTSISSTIDYGGVPVFIETKEGTYVADEEQVERAIKEYPNVAGMILPHLLGNIPNIEKILDSLNGRWLIEDNCDTLGGHFDGVHTGNFGDFAAFSFYGSHHISTAGVGGAIGTNDEELSKLAKSIIFWGHHYDNHTNKNRHSDFLNRYATQTIGSDFQMSGIQAGFGLAQIEKLPRFVEARKKQFKELDDLFHEKGKEYFIFPTSDPRSEPSWFSYPLVVRESAPFTREEFVSYLTGNYIEVRPIMCGNLIRQTPFAKVKKITLDNERFPIGDSVEERGFFIPAWGMPENQKRDYHETLEKALDVVYTK